MDGGGGPAWAARGAVQRLAVIFGACLVLLLVVAGAAEAEHAIVVTTTNDPGIGSLRAAILQAGAAPGPPHRIHFAPALDGTTIRLQSALPAIDLPGHAGLAITAAGLPRGITIDGGDAAAVGLAIHQAGVRVLGPVTVTGFTEHGVRLAPSASEVLLRNLTIAANGGDAPGGGLWLGGHGHALEAVRVTGNTGTHGGGLFLSDEGDVADAPRRFTDLVVAGNRATATGGGFVALGGTNAFTGLVVEANQADAEAGGVLLSAGRNTITNGTIAANEARIAGGIAVLAGVNNLTDLAVTGNKATTGAPGGVYIQDGRNSFVAVAVTGNTAATDAGGLLILGGVNNLTAARIDGNRALAGSGGALYIEGGTNRFTDAAIEGNDASLDAGGVILFDGVNLFTNTSITGNQAGVDGGGGFAAGGTNLFQDARVTANSANRDGGGLLYSGDGGLALPGTLVAGNTAGRDGANRHGDPFPVHAAATIQNASRTGIAGEVTGLEPGRAYRIDAYVAGSCATGGAGDRATVAILAHAQFTAGADGRAAFMLAFTPPSPGAFAVTATLTLLKDDVAMATGLPGPCRDVPAAPPVPVAVGAPFAAAADAHVEVTTGLPGTVTALALQLAADCRACSVHIETAASAPPGAPREAPGFVPLSFISLELVENGTVRGDAVAAGRLGLAVPAGVDAETATLLHAQNGRWQPLATTCVAGACNATLPAFSLFALASDTAPPVINSMRPTDAVDMSRPTIGAEWADNRGIDPTGFRFTLNGQPRGEGTGEIALDAHGFSYRPAVALAPGQHEVVVTIRDVSGHETSAGWTFTVPAPPAPAWHARVAVLGVLVLVGETALVAVLGPGRRGVRPEPPGRPTSPSPGTRRGSSGSAASRPGSRRGTAR